MENNIKLLYILSDQSLNMAIVSIKSLLMNNQTNFLDFYFAFDENFNIKNLKNIETVCKDKIVKSINYIKIDSQKYSAFNTKVICSERNYIFEIHNLINEDKILFMNPYSIINENLSEFYNIDLDNHSCAACEYLHSDKIESNIQKNLSLVFSNTIILINLKLWRENNIYDKCMKIIKDVGIDEKLAPISLFNIVINDCKLLNYKYNYSEENRNIDISCSIETKKQYKKLLAHIDEPIIISFLGESPIGEISCKNSYTSKWWKYAEQTSIYEEIKDYKISNKYKLSSTSAENSFKYSWLLSRIYPYIKPYWFRILLGFAIAVPLGLLDGVTAFALKPYMDYVVGGKTFLWNFHGLEISITSLQMAFILPIGVILFAAIQGVLRYLNSYLAAWTSWKISNGVKFDLFHRLIYMHPQFFDDNSSGIIISRYMSDPVAASAGVVEQIKTITTSFFGALGLIAVMIYSSWKLAAIGVLVLCIAFLPVALIRKRIKEASNKGLVIGGKITTNINETYSGNKVMAAYGLQPRQEQYFRDQVTDSFNISMSLTKRTGWMSPLMYQIASFGIAAVLGVGTYLINIGQMTAGSFASFVTSLLLLYKPVKTLGNTLTGIQGIFVAMGRVFELFDLEPAIKDCENPKELKGLNKSIDFENVYFEYIPNNPVLKNLNLHINKNETLAIVGNSGGGKSTLVNLLPRFYDIKSGSIKFDGTDIREFSLDSLRQNISMVFQDNFLYSGTIKENIMMGNPNATSEELIIAIQSAHLQDMIQELPEGLETELGERGLTLSGGQRQRVAIARAMLRNAPIVILDEATSALDNESEAIVQRAMDNLMKDRTVFIIAHRLSTIKNADRIAVINEGELVELGTHEELMNIENGQYKALYEMQFKKQEVLTNV